jgi:flagellin-like protein
MTSRDRGQVGIGTLAVFIAMVLVALIAGGVLMETTGLLQGKSAAAGQGSADRVTDRVGVESATASYSSGSMDSIDVVLSKAPGSGDVDLNEVVVHWLGPNGSTELTDSTFSISPVKGSGTVIEDRSDRVELSSFGKTIPDGTPATVRFITADGGTTTVILRSPNAPPKNGAVSLLWRSPSGNPASGSGTATATVTATATATPSPTPTPSGPSLIQQWSTSPDKDPSWISDVAAESGSRLYAVNDTYSDDEIWEVDPDTGSVLDSVVESAFDRDLEVDKDDEAIWYGGQVSRWNRNTDAVEELNLDPGTPIDTVPYGGDLYYTDADTADLVRYKSDGTIVWSDSGKTSRGVDTTSNAVYASWGGDVRKWDHDGNVQWTVNTASALDPNYEIAAGHASYVFATGNDGEIFRLPKDGTTHTKIHTATGTKTDLDIDVGPADNLYVADLDGKDLTVLNADGSEILTKSYGSVVRNVEARSDGVYVAVGDSLRKYTKNGF